MTPTQFLHSLSQLKFEHAFNPYSDRCDTFDLDNAPAIRMRNLSMVLLSALTHSECSIWIGRDLGYKGGRRTGLALTDDFHLRQHGRMFAVDLQRATRGPAIPERTSTIVWNMLAKIEKPIFLWNVFPLHPYEDGNPRSNRSHNSAEAKQCDRFLSFLFERLNPPTIVAIGREAQQTLDKMSIKHVAARHPSYGGKNDFEKAIYSTYDCAVLSDRFESQCNLL